MSITACPGCVAGGTAGEITAERTQMPTHEILLPTIHCIACVNKIEKILGACADIVSVRVNLSRKRALIIANPDADPQPWLAIIHNAGFEAHLSDTPDTTDTSAGLLLRIGIAGFAMMNVMLLSVAVWSGASDTTRDLFHWISAFIALPATVFCAQPFFKNAWNALKNGAY